MNKNKIDYTEKVIFFLDLLGFKSIIEGQNKKAPSDIKKIFDEINFHLDDDIFFKPINLPKSKTTKQTIQFSDSIIISFDIKEPSQLFYTLLDILRLQACLIYNHDVLLRGACQKGDVFHDNNLVFGPAVNAAYNYEKNHSKYPRIIIPNDIIDECSNYSSVNHKRDEELSYIKKILQKDKDNYYFLDYISHDSASSELGSDEEWALYMDKLKLLIERGLKSDDSHIKQKYSWLKKKFNLALNANIIRSYKKQCGIILNKIK